MACIFIIAIPLKPKSDPLVPSLQQILASRQLGGQRSIYAGPAYAPHAATDRYGDAIQSVNVSCAWVLDSQGSAKLCLVAGGDGVDLILSQDEVGDILEGVDSATSAGL